MSHFYSQDGAPRYFVSKKDGKGNRPAHIGDCRKNAWVPGPSEVLKLLAKPNLTQWLQVTAATAVLTSPRREGEDLDAFVNRVLFEDREQDEERDAAGEAGTAIHEAIQLRLEGKPFNPSYTRYVEAVMSELDPRGRAVATEKVLVGDGYAGRTDAVLESDDCLYVVDFKGCKNLPKGDAWPEHRMQIGAYCGALGNTGTKRIEGVLVYILRSEPGVIKVCSVPDWQIEFRKFNLLLDYWYLANDVPRHAEPAEMPQEELPIQNVIIRENIFYQRNPL